ncbi:MAG: AAA family ATPase [Pirellulales bacterium]|nr:AAA family ATPase [Pirellulales bacterium]
MSVLNDVIQNPSPSAPKGIVYGPPGVGKTTFGATAEASILVDCENGAGAIPCKRTPYLATWPEIEKWLLAVQRDEHVYKTLVIDSIDWLLRRLEEHVAGTCAEQVVSARYGIPTTFWTETRSCKRTEAEIAGIYEKIDPLAMHRGALWALSDHHRRLDYPFIRKGRTRAKYGRRVSFQAHACNLLPGAMEVPLPTDGPGFRWAPIRHVDVQPYSGPVYSLDVKKYRHYIADGIVTHNCFYGWKLGAGHQFFGPNNATDLWAVKKVNPQSMIHLTEKPVELALRAIQYSSKPGENVLELFGGSGSTLIACEQTGRHCFAMELDELYCDVICARYAQFSGKSPIRESDGAEWSRLQAA